MSKRRFLRGCAPLVFFIGAVIQGVSFFMADTSIWVLWGALTLALFCQLMALSWA